MIDVIKPAVAAGRYYIGPHAGLRQADRMITTDDLQEAFGSDAPEVIEDYPDDPRGHTCLVRGETADKRILHLVCAEPDNTLFIVTCYQPDPAIWYPQFKKRRGTP